MFDSLHAKLEGAFKKIRGRGVLTAKDIESTMKEVRMALLEADVNFKVAKDFCDSLGQKSQGSDTRSVISKDPEKALKSVGDLSGSALGLLNQ